MKKSERLALAERINREGEFKAMALITGQVYVRDIQSGYSLLVETVDEWNEIWKGIHEDETKRPPRSRFSAAPWLA